MKKMIVKVLAPVLLLAPLAVWGFSRTGEPSAPEIGIPNRIAWYATVKSGLAEAKRSGRPILLTSAAPQCEGVSGMW